MGFNVARHRLIEKFLAAVEIELNEVVHSVFYRRGQQTRLRLRLH